jgi:hypothetical protein
MALLPSLAGVAVLLVVWFAGRAENPGPLGFRLDDAWIHQVYARGLLADGYLAYNEGVPATGSTSPLWSACLALLRALSPGAPSPEAVVVGATLAGALLHLVAVGVGAALARRISGDRLTALVAGGLIAFATPLAAAAYSGMEVSLTACLLLLGVRSAASDEPGWAGLWLALAGLARPESGVVTLVVLAALARRAAPAARGRVLITAALPSLTAGAALCAYALWASGAPLPATFYAKSSFQLLDLPARILVAAVGIFPRIPPFAAGVGWLFLLGLVPGLGGATRGSSSALPLLAGGAFVLANLAVVDPVDPAAFYHQRYLLPAVPLLLVALALGARALALRLPERLVAAPAMALLALAAVGVASTALPESRHLHNDVRNINEVQRALGEWLAERLPPGTWIAATDAGAVRYFSNLPTLDALGLNTPQMLEPDDAFIRAHPVAALVWMPAWFRPARPELLEVLHSASTRGYGVTSNPRMAHQTISAAARAAGARGPVRVAFDGAHRFALDLLPAVELRRQLEEARRSRSP